MRFPWVFSIGCRGKASFSVSSPRCCHGTALHRRGVAQVLLAPAARRPGVGLLAGVAAPEAAGEGQQHPKGDLVTSKNCENMGGTWGDNLTG